MASLAWSSAIRTAKQKSPNARARIEVRRLGLTWDQVQQYNPPPNFVKEKDKRTKAYKAEFGIDQCWELDALSPTVIVDLIRTAIEALIDWDRWNAALQREKRNRKLLDSAADNWTLVAKALV